MPDYEVVTTFVENGSACVQVRLAPVAERMPKWRADGSAEVDKNGQVVYEDHPVCYEPIVRIPLDALRMRQDADTGKQVELDDKERAALMQAAIDAEVQRHLPPPVSSADDIKADPVLSFLAGWKA